MTLQDYEAKVCAAYGVRVEELYGASKAADVSTARYLVWNAMMELGYKKSTIARMYNRTAASVHTGLRKLEAMLAIGENRLVVELSSLTSCLCI